MLKVLIAEDHESSNISVRKTMEDLGISPDPVYYCDTALSRIQKALKEDQPYDILVTDLSFEADGNVQQLQDGPALIAAARKLQPGLKVLVFSIEKKAAVIDKLFQELRINGYVSKGRNDAQELRAAIADITAGKRHYPIHLRQAVKQLNAHDFTAYDITLLTQLAAGTLQKNIPVYLEKHRIRPSGLSSVEKRLNLIRAAFGFTTNEQLVSFCKGNGII